MGAHNRGVVGRWLRVTVVASFVATVWGRPAETAASDTTPSGDPPVTLDASFDVGGGRKLAIMCWGDGSPIVFYDAGTTSSGIDTLLQVRASLELAQTTRLCTYDRAGLGRSDPAPNRPRTIDDIVDDLHALLVAAELRPPYLFVGSSGGGGQVYHQAGRYPDEAAGIVLVDVPSPQPDLTEEMVGGSWDKQPEHMDYAGVERQLATARLPIPAIPVTVITADQGQSNAADQVLWLEGSSHPLQVIASSGHDVFGANPRYVLLAVNEMLSYRRMCKYANCLPSA